MFRYLFLLILVMGCSSSPVPKENAYHGEPLSKIAPNGLVVAYIQVPKDSFPHDRKSTIIYFENMKTKEQYQYGETNGPIYMKLPPGDYRLVDFWKPNGCNTATGIMLTNFFHELPSSVHYLRMSMEREPASTLNFRIASGRMTDIGNMLLTCMEWDARDKFKKEFVSYIEDGKFQMFKLSAPDAQECGCKLLRKKDGVSLAGMKKDLAK